MRTAETAVQEYSRRVPLPTCPPSQGGRIGSSDNVVGSLREPFMLHWLAVACLQRKIHWVARV